MVEIITNQQQLNCANKNPWQLSVYSRLYLYSLWHNNSVKKVWD